MNSRKIISCITTSLIVLFLCSQSIAYSKPSKTLPKSFKLTSLTKKSTIGPKSFKGRTIVLDFWASWCESCGETMEKVHKAIKGSKGVVYLSATVDEEKDVALEWFDEQTKSVQKLKKYAYLDEDTKLATGLGVKAVPAIYIIKNGKVVLSISGNPTKKELKMIKSLVSK